MFLLPNGERKKQTDFWWSHQEELPILKNAAGSDGMGRPGMPAPSSASVISPSNLSQKAALLPIPLPWFSLVLWSEGTVLANDGGKQSYPVSEVKELDILWGNLSRLLLHSQVKAEQAGKVQKGRSILLYKQFWHCLVFLPRNCIVALPASKTNLLIMAAGLQAWWQRHQPHHFFLFLCHESQEVSFPFEHWLPISQCLAAALPKHKHLSPLLTPLAPWAGYPADRNHWSRSNVNKATLI